ncbi:MAG: hypothetical protein ACD_45C00688G0004 [uncultured bacterium]|nr:MAG: hypothetical protein ACD_45C00688G0004 [uncultured bacterium]
MKRLIENALNSYLALDPESAARIASLQNKTITIELRNTPFQFQLVFGDDKVKIRWDNFSDPDMTIKGTPFSLLHMSMAPEEQRQRFFADDVMVEGDMELAQPVLAILNELDIDWEEQLSHWIGDVSAHHVGRVVQETKNFSTRLQQTFMRNISEYLQEEINLTPSPEALRDFFYDVDKLREQVDRLEIRTERLVKGIKHQGI